MRVDRSNQLWRRGLRSLDDRASLVLRPQLSETPVPSSRSRTPLIALEIVVALTAIGGGLALVTGLEGGRFPLSWLAGTPFADYTGPGLILAVAVGGSAAWAAAALVRGSSIAGRLSLAAGLVLVGWIVGEIVLVRADNELVSPMEAFYLVAGLVMVGLAADFGRSTRGRAS